MEGGCSETLPRQLQEEDKEGGSGGSTRRPNIKNMSGGLSPDEFASFLEPIFRKVVREEVERAIPCFHDPSLSLYRRASSNPVGTSEESSLRLQFLTKLPGTIFTNSQIEAEDGAPLRIELVDGRTNERVTSDPLSSIKIEIVVLNGDFGSDEEEDWTEKEFNGNITSEREGKRPLITGELTAMLQGGICCLRNLIITDNSSWMRCRKFRLGARAVQKVTAEIRIREARSETFVVKDHRGVLNKKHHPPSLSDEVWRLEKVAKDGTLQKRMTSRGINTVQDFLQLYEADASSLKNIIGNRVTDRIWETMVKHARTCVVDDSKMYAYYQASNQASIVFNSVMKVAQATADGQTYQSLDKLTHSQKILVQNLRRQAYYNKNQWVPLNALPSITPPSALTNLPTESLIGLSPLLHHLDYTVVNQAENEPHLYSDRPEVTAEFNYSLASTSHCYNVTENRQLDCLEPQNHITAKIINQTVVDSLAREDFLSDLSASESSHHPGYSHGPFARNHSSPEELFKVPSSIPGNWMWTPEHTFVIGSSSGADFGICPSGTGFGVWNSRISKPRAAWCKIRAVVKWGSVRRIVAAKRTAMFNCAHY
ncbi:calmodulin-binding protein 60 B-like isoform X2 [Syzygium oleosum]|uniref:calmodulin-binding protein 60 B-like isoform X2 n=1 Tax=Syzygium oleosum TaxID=219896 RepID=UPI0024BA8786|nr:calmodulin-binding protein 60 B-like isoform X2 [Syzygium oleosum]